MGNPSLIRSYYLNCRNRKMYAEYSPCLITSEGENKLMGIQGEKPLGLIGHSVTAFGFRS